MRRSGRIPQKVPILLIGTDLEGAIFSERTNTILLSLHGASVASKRKLSPEQELVLRWPARHKEADIRVIGQLGTSDHRFAYGVSFFDPQLKFWEVEFPPVSGNEREFGLISLVCFTCQTLEKIDDAGFEADICSIEGGVLRYCKRCGSSTLWKSAQAATADFAPPVTASASPQNAGSVAVSSPQASFAVPLPPLAKSAQPARVDRRKYPRIKINYVAMVRHPNRTDELVQCEDVSRGGLRFKTRTRYFAESLIEVAAPYSSGQPAIFVPAKIVFAQELPEQNLIRYGVALLKAIPPRGAY